MKERLAQDRQRRALQEIVKERRRQDEKWGEQNYNPIVWVSILGEEFGELCKAVNEKESFDELVEEVIQVGAVAVAMLENLQREFPLLFERSGEEVIEVGDHVSFKTSCTSSGSIISGVGEVIVVPNELFQFYFVEATHECKYLCRPEDVKLYAKNGR